MECVDDGSEELISPQLGTSSNHGSPNGSGPDLDGMGPSSINTMIKGLRDMLLPLVLGFAEFDLQNHQCSALSLHVFARLKQMQRTPLAAPARQGL